jgi:hypothetical protein
MLQEQIDARLLLFVSRLGRLILRHWNSPCRRRRRPRARTRQGRLMGRASHSIRNNLAAGSANIKVPAAYFEGRAVYEGA